MELSNTALSNTAARTRRDIVAAAIEAWSTDSGTSLTEIARRAGVGRTTLNRYFSSREDLVTEVDRVARAELGSALAQAELGRGTGLAALLRAAESLLAAPAILGLIFTDNPVIDPDAWDGSATREADSSLQAAITRGHRDGTIDPDLPVEWVETFLWTTLLAAQLSLAGGRPARRVAGWLERSLTGGIGSTTPPPSTSPPTSTPSTTREVDR